MENNTSDIRELIRRFELSNRAENKSLKTIQWYTEMLQKLAWYLEKNFGTADLEFFNIDTARVYSIHLRGKVKFSEHPFTPAQHDTLSPKTIQCHVRVLKTFSSWLHAEGYTNGNRLQNLKLPKAPNTIIEPLTPREINSVVASIDGKTYCGARNYAIFVTMLDTGLRASETASVRLSDANLTDGFIKVMGKGSKERVVPIGEHVQMVLFNYITRARPKPVNPDCDNLFLSASGRPITVNTLKLMFSRLAKISGVTRLHAHLCRHTFATNYLLNGGDIFSLKEILGHTTFEMVNHYLHFTNSQITGLHHRFSPMDKFIEKEEENG